MSRVLLIDNYDSFTFNLVQRMGELGARVEVIRNDALTSSEILARKPTHIVLSPGPCTPDEAGVCLELVARACGLNGFARPARAVPILGVCLGHQSIGQAFGGRGHRGGQRSRRRVARGAGQGARLGGRGVRRGGGEGGGMRVLLIDNYDSFTFNLVQRLGELGAQVEVVRNDALTAAQILDRRPERLVLSPGPCTPDEAGVCLELIERASTLEKPPPMLGVCLGHQSIGQAFGGRVVRAREPVHGKPEEIVHDGSALFRGLPRPFRAGRYHSLVVEEKSLPPSLKVSARTKDGIVMALRHKKLPVFGVQFHPESILTPDGQTLLRNFLHAAA